MKINKSIFDVKNGKYENRLFVQFLLLVMIPLIVMGIVSYNIYIKGETAKNRQVLESYCESVAGEYKNLFSSIKEYYLDSTSSTSFKWLVNQKKIPYTNYNELKQAQNMLQGNYFMTKYVSMYNFVNVKEGWVLNNYGMSDYNDLKNKVEIDKFLEEQKENPRSIYWLNRRDVLSPYSDTAKESQMTDTTGEILVIKEEYSRGNLIYLLTVQLNTRELFNISQAYKKLGYDVTVLSDNKVLMETNSELTDIYQTCINSEAESLNIEHAYKGASGKRYHISVQPADENGLIYITGYDTTTIKKSGIAFVFASIGIMVVFGVILIILRVVAEAFSQPLLLLQKFVDDQSIQIKELFISNLVKGELSTEKIGEIMRKHDMISWNSYRMIGIAWKTEQEDDSINSKKNQLNREVLESLPEMIRESFFITAIIYNHIFLFIIGENKDEDTDNKTALVYKQIKDYVGENYHCQIAFGISRIFHKLTHTRRAYDECVEALHNPRHQTDPTSSTLVLYDDYAFNDTMNNVYDKIMENELINAIDSCKLEDAKQLLELILERMEVKSVIGMERNFYVTRLLTAVIEVSTKSMIPLGDVFDSEQYNVLSKATQIYDKKELVTYIMQEIIHPVTVALSKQRQSGTSDIVKQITKMVKESKGNITLNECADVLNYHPNYVCKVLKKERGITFTDMANEEKIKLAKYMLLTTDYSIAEISEKLQYTNVQNFIRFFKNQVEITPSVFRKSHRE